MKCFSEETPVSSSLSLSPVVLHTTIVTGTNIALVMLQLKPERVAINASAQGSFAMLMSKVPEISNALLITPPLCKT